VIPLHDDNPTRRRPVLTISLIVANVLVFVLVQLLQVSDAGVAVRPDDGNAADSSQAVVCEYGLVPEHLIGGGDARASDGGDGRPATCLGVNQRQSRYLGLVTSQFLHGGWLHLLGNMLFLWVFGNNIEDRLGRFRFLPFYLLCGALAAGAQALADPDSDVPLIGASGAIAGILGAYLVLFPRAGIWTIVLPFFFLPFKIPAWVWLAIYMALQFLLLGSSDPSGQGGVAYWAHIGGFVVGMLLVRPFLTGRPPPGRPAPVPGPSV
jgi:membrane associated rhomboid family serine protease